MVDEITLMEKNGDEYNTQHLDTLNVLYDKFVAAYPKDTLAVRYLLSSAQSSYTRGTEDARYLEAAIQKFSSIIANYGESKEVEMAIFLLGSIYENKGDTVKAREFYEQYVKKYPAGSYAESVRSILDGNVGLSAEEWMKKFQLEGKIDSLPKVK